jgi:voltage-gated sodium channel
MNPQKKAQRHVLPTSPRGQRAAARIANAAWFQNAIVSIIVLNALILGLESFDTVAERAGGVLTAIDHILLGVFVVEIFIRFAAAGLRPIAFLRSPWNVFDTTIVAAAFIPGLAANTTVLRLVRLLRVARLLRLMPDIHVLLDGLRRALKPAASLLGLTFLIVYLYAVLGWSLFGTAAPQYFGNVAEGMLTLFTLLTLEGWNEILGVLRDASPWALPYTLSFILIGTFVVLNLVIGVVITSLDEAYSATRSRREGADLARAIDSVRTSLDDLERQISGTPGDPRLLGRDTPPS